jgi:hypothetical protein
VKLQKQGGPGAWDVLEHMNCNSHVHIINVVMTRPRKVCCGCAVEQTCAALTRANNMQFSRALRISCVATVVACCFVGMLFVAIQCEYCCCAVIPQQQWGGVYTPSSNLPSQCSAASACMQGLCMWNCVLWVFAGNSHVHSFKLSGLLLFGTSCQSCCLLCSCHTRVLSHSTPCCWSCGCCCCCCAHVCCASLC